MLIFLLLLNCVYSLVIPASGNIYKKTLFIPFLGEQIIETEFSNNNLFYIRLNGLVVENGTAKFHIEDENINIILGNNLKTLMKKRRSEFTFTKYDYCEDKLYVRIYIRPIFFKKNIVLERINN